MRDLLIDLNKYLGKYKYIIGFLVLAVILFLLVSRQYDKMRNRAGDSSTNTTISASASNQTSVNQISHNANITKVEDVSTYIETDKDVIKAFYTLCKDNKLDVAYDMLTDDCKQLLYPTLEDFKNNYYNVIFKTNKDIEIISFKNNTYRVNFNEEAITMGNTNSKGMTDYVTVANENKLNISGFIKQVQLNTKSVQQYFSAEVTKRQVFVDYELLSVSIKNNIKADMYINDSSESGMYIVDSTGKAFYVESGEYFDNDYFVSSESKKTFILKFKKQYNANPTEKIIFNNIKIENKKYYENINNQSVEKTTDYPEKTSAAIDIN